MSLQPIPTSSSNRSEQAAQRIIQQIKMLSESIIALRKNGLPAQPERTLPNGQVIAEQPAVSGADIDAKLGSENVAVLDALASALSTSPNPTAAPTTA